MSGINCFYRHYAASGELLYVGISVNYLNQRRKKNLKKLIEIAQNCCVDTIDMIV